MTSCEDYLDKAPSMGVDESEIYGSYSSVMLFFDGAYKWLTNEFELSSQMGTYAWNSAMSDECASVYNSSGMAVPNSGNWGGYEVSGYEFGDNGNAALATDNASVIYRAYRTIRICNAVLDNIDSVPMTDTQYNNLLGQAYFLRAWGYFQVMRRYGGMPDLTILHDEITAYNVPRLTYHESNELLIADLDAAIELLPLMWDESNIGRASKLSAMGLKAMAMSYDASPLMQNGLDSTVDKGYDKTRALAAAQYLQEVIDYVNANASTTQTRLSCVDGSDLSADEYEKIFVWDLNSYSYDYKPEEALWYKRDIGDSHSSDIRRIFLPHHWAAVEDNAGGRDTYMYYAPTQNIVDMFECLGDDGNYYPISLDQSGYPDRISPDGSVTDMWVDRDPRLCKNILLPGQWRGIFRYAQTPIENTYYAYYDDDNNLTYNTMRTTDYTQQVNIQTRQQSGYVINKFVHPDFSNNQYGSDAVLYNNYVLYTVYMRVTHLYLYFAEMAYEATGSYDTPPTGCTLTAEDALNTIRNRGGITDWVRDTEDFRDAYRREFAVELMFEHSRWFDIRRWMIAEDLFKASSPIYGVFATRNGYDSSYEATTPSTIDESTYAFDGYYGENMYVAGFRNDPIEKGTFVCKPEILSPEVRVFTSKNYWYPFSTKDVDALSNLVQNPGW